MNCMFCFRMCAKRKPVKKRYLKSISVAVRFIELPRIKYIRGGYIALAATDKYISVAAGRFEPPWICRGIRGGSIAATATDNDISVVVRKFEPPWICRGIHGGSFTATATDTSIYPWRFVSLNHYGYV